MKKTVIRIQNLKKSFGDTLAVGGVNLDIADGEFFALLGPSGCGKTTLLRMLGGFERPQAGAIFMDGADITPLPPNKRPLNMLFQSYAVFPHLSVADNVAYGLRMEKCPPQECAQRVAEVLQLVQMQDTADRMPHQLSGGQRQRVALARALVKKPRVLLLDEPLSALDAKLRYEMQAELVRLQKQVGITFIVVTHDQDEALSMADRIAVMERGVFRQIDTPPALYENPNSRFVAEFIGRMNIRPAALLAAGEHAQRISAPGLGEVNVPHAPLAAAPGAQLYYGVRPEKIVFTSAPAQQADARARANDGERITLAAKTERCSYYGDETLLTCAGEDGRQWLCSLTNRARHYTPPPAGSAGILSWRPADMLLFEN